jgi:guanylate kinase
MTGAGGEKVARRGLMLVLSSPSGTGKTTLSRRLLEVDPAVQLSVSATTRPQRPAEVDGRDYHFVDRARFDEMVRKGQLLEWAEVFGNRYGTPRAPVEEALSRGKDVLFDIDWQGTQQVYRKMRDDVVSVFVLPPTADELKHRLERRAEDTPDVIARRLRNAAEEIPHWTEYDYVLVNRDLDKSFARLRSILTAERLKRVKMPDLERFVGGLLGDLKKLTP